MLVDHLLFPFAFQNNDKVIKSTDNSPHLKAVHQKKRCILTLLTQSSKHSVLQIDFVSHNNTSVAVAVYGIIVHRVFADILSNAAGHLQTLHSYYNISSGCCHPFSAR